MRKNKRKIFISVLFLLILFISLIFLIPTKTNSTKNIVPEKIEKVKKNDKSKRKKKKEPEKKDKPKKEESIVEENQEPAAEKDQEPVAMEEQVVEEASTPVRYSNVITPYAHSDFKTYMYASAITNTASAQYQLISRAYVGDYGIMMVDGCYLVAMGTAYANYIGQKYQVTFETGQVINVMIGDVKQDIHTDQYNSAGIANGDLLEFIVSQPPQEVTTMGSYNVIFPGKVAYLTMIN